MALVMNASSQEQQIRVHGAWFTFKPKQMKDMHEDKVFFLTSTAAYLGFVGLPDSLADLEFRASEEGKAILQAAEEQGIRNRIEYLEMLKTNETVSLQRDLDQQGLKYDSRLEVKPAMMKNFEELVSYKAKKQDEAQKQVDRIKEIEELLKD